MGTHLKMRHCEQCDATTEHLEFPPNHILHLLLAIVVGGIGAVLFRGGIATAIVTFLGYCMFIWMPASFLQKSPECRTCGKKIGFWKL